MAAAMETVAANREYGMAGRGIPDVKDRRGGAAGLLLEVSTFGF